MARRTRFASPLVVALVALAASSLLAAPAQASSRDSARVDVRIEDDLGNPAQNRLVVVSVGDPASSTELRTDSYGRASVRVPVAAEGSVVTIDLSGTSVVGEALREFEGVVPRDRIEVEATLSYVTAPFQREPQDEEFFDFDADGDGLDDALYRWQRPGLPDVLAVDIDADGAGVESERVGAGDMRLSVEDIDLDGADEVVLSGVDGAGDFTGQVWTYDPASGDEDSFGLGDGGGWLYWSQLDGAAGLDPWWVADPSGCGAGPIERILSDGTRERIEFPAGALGFPHAADFDADAVGDLRCATYTWGDAYEWTVWQWSSATGGIEEFTAPGSSARAPFEVDCDADGVQETVIAGEFVTTPEGRDQMYRAYEFGGEVWEAQLPDYTVPFACPGA